MVNIEKDAEEFDVKGIVITMVLSAVGFLTALTWRDAIKVTIEEFIPIGEGLAYSYYAAGLVTLFAIVITYILIKIRKTNIVPDEYEESFKKHTIGRASKIATEGSPFQIRQKLGIVKPDIKSKKRSRRLVRSKKAKRKTKKKSKRKRR
jgi:hypothetical protein